MTAAPTTPPIAETVNAAGIGSSALLSRIVALSGGKDSTAMVHASLQRTFSTSPIFARRAAGSASSVGRWGFMITNLARESVTTGGFPRRRIEVNHPSPAGADAPAFQRKGLMDKQDRIARELKTFLPGFAFPERTVRAGGERDFRASFAGDEKTYISVALEYGDHDSPCLVITRSGFVESEFSMRELQNVHAVIGALLLAVRNYRGQL